MGWFGLFGRNRHERIGFELYAKAVASARSPVFYEELGVPDTLDGRFDMVGLHAFLLIRRLRTLPPPGAALAQAVFDAMFNDMDVTLREMGVGDLGVGRRVKLMWEGFHGRSSVYQSALDQGDLAALAQALSRNVWRETASGQDARRLSEIVTAQDHHLAAQDLAAFSTATVTFQPVQARLPA